MDEDTLRNESALEQRIKQLVKYMTVGLILLLVVGVLSGISFYKVSNEKQVAETNSQVQAETTKNSSWCTVYPDDDVCKMSRSIAANPTETVVPADGRDGNPGTNGQDGRGVTTFSKSPEGDLIVSFTDGQTQNVGRVVGTNGIDGINGKDGRGILSANVESGNLIIGFTDGTSSNLGMVIGPAGATGSQGTKGDTGDTGATGEPGQPGTNGSDGVSVIDIKVDSLGYVNVTYSNGTTSSAGRVIINTVKALSCESDTLTMTMMDGSTLSATVDCTPDNPVVPAPAPAIAPATSTTTP